MYPIHSKSHIIISQLEEYQKDRIALNWIWQFTPIQPVHRTCLCDIREWWRTYKHWEMWSGWLCNQCLHYRDYLVYQLSVDEGNRRREGERENSTQITYHFDCTSCNVIYCIRCTACNQLYIGETGRRLGDHFRKHLLDVKKKTARKYQ